MNNKQKKQREAYEDEHYTAKVDCYFHKGKNHTATIHKEPHRYAGIVECDQTGESDMCEHNGEKEIETATTDHLGFNGHYQTEHEFYICDICGMEIDGDPEEDRADSIADTQTMQALGK